MNIYNNINTRKISRISFDYQQIGQMRLFEVDAGSARDVLAVLQGQADRAGQSSTIPFAAVMKLIKPFGLGISSPDGLIALKNAVDPAGDIIADILDNGSIVLNTKQPDANQTAKAPAGNGSNLDAMAASGAKKLTPEI